ncbi:flagellar biosynthetic protein FliR [Paenibacillus urinalis]|uniref:Flagellar biosynthetic protein FliR n=1 Tax=Paenibacillus urinalis TaxID=521520 RepID=A0AAX3N678_9BACL|nr:flagellar biosynthetic protein FliR [Paenibacillus urinalis]WDH84499.1 flagellar biosynthetic protein FliR [Paenibacillus urinalis]WDH95965.1 flagellar biosynthetic protein FliR [Paenibacillus urinalis]WDI04183.1 flagellar biosynthetic protein FliR [Paenibacillus urinalis]
MEMMLQGFSVALLIFCRITAFFVAAPIFSTPGVPGVFKIGISFFITVIVYLTFGLDQSIPMDGQYILLIVKEILMGLLLGYIALLMITAIQTAGAFIDIQIGFGMANVYDPMTGAAAPLTGNVKYAFAVLLFLTMNGHHRMLDAIVYSYEWVPLVGNDLFAAMASGNIAELIITAFAQAFMLAFQLAAPLVVALFMTDVGLGFLARTAPQFNVFVIGVPLKILVGLAMMLVTIPGLLYLFENLFAVMFEAMQGVLEVIKQGA